MQKLIPTIYFYTLSAIGMVLLIIGLFNSIHFITGVTAYDKYPLTQGSETRCDYIPKEVNPEAGNDAMNKDEVSNADGLKDECLKSLEKERQNKKADDLEKSISFTVIGLIIFGSHFYFARRRSS